MYIFGLEYFFFSFFLYFLPISRITEIWQTVQVSYGLLHFAVLGSQFQYCVGIGKSGIFKSSTRILYYLLTNTVCLNLKNY